MRQRLLGHVSAAALVALVLAQRTARAGMFDDSGAFVFDQAAVATDDFEEPASDGGAHPTEDARALSGSHVARISSSSALRVRLGAPAEARTYRVSAWIRDGEVAADLEISYGDRVSDVATLYPTGRITSDGWVELANEHIPIDGARASAVELSMYAPDKAAVDAVELVPDGGLEKLAHGAHASCSGVTDAVSCGLGQVCLWSECRNASNWVPPIPVDRDAVADYLAARVRLLFGPFAERSQDLAFAEIALDQMKLAADPLTYWNGFLLAIRRLHDGHTSTSGLPDYVFGRDGNRRPIAACFLEGDSDLTHATAPKDPDYLDVLVSHASADHALGLAPGDRLVHVDGQHPIAWARSLITVHWGLEPTSNHSTFAELASTLRGLISRYATTIDVIHCNADTMACGDVETISIDALPPLPKGTAIQNVSCDNRPLRHLASSPADHATGDAVYRGLVAESSASERVYGIEWESLYTTNGSDGVGADLSLAVAEWKSQSARGVILDHRMGFGGTILGPQILWNFAIPSHALDYYEDRQHAEDEQPSLDDGFVKFQMAQMAGKADIAGSQHPVTNVPVALLLTQDVSASDWLALGMSGAPNVRRFAPFPTNGGFSTRYGFGYWLGMNFVFAVGDTYAADGRTLNGHGVEPDVVVLPTQSDLLAGKDTVYEAALAWVREHLAP